MSAQDLATRHLARPYFGVGFLLRILHFGAQARSRRALARLDDRLLRDIGLTRDEAQTILDRPLWDAPPHWRG